MTVAIHHDMSSVLCDEAINVLSIGTQFLKKLLREIFRFTLSLIQLLAFLRFLFASLEVFLHS